MSKETVALNKAIRLLREGAAALGEALIARRRPLKEAYGLTKDDGTRITPIDLYNVVNQAASGYGGEVGSNLAQAASFLYKASTAYSASGQQQQPAVPAAPAAAPAAPAAPLAGSATTESRRVPKGVVKRLR